MVVPPLMAQLLVYSTGSCLLRRFLGYPRVQWKNWGLPARVGGSERSGSLRESCVQHQIMHSTMISWHVSRIPPNINEMFFGRFTGSSRREREERILAGKLREARGRMEMAGRHHHRALRSRAFSLWAAGARAAREERM
jgi:hypothetical protein